MTEPYERRTTLLLSPEVDEILDPRAGLFGGRSVAVRSILLRYAAIVQREKPELSDAEWNLLRELNGVWHQDQPWAIAVLEAGVADSIRLAGLDQKWEVDGAELLRKLRALSFAQKVALVDAVEVWWATDQEQEAST